MSNMTDLWLLGVFFSSSKYSKTRPPGELMTLPQTS